MSFAILRHGKIKNTTRGVANSHNHRIGDDPQDGKKINIDKTKSHLNIYHDGDGALDRLKEKLPANYRKDAVVAIEILLTSGPEFFDEIETDREKLAENPKFLKWVDKSISWAKKEFGANVVDCVLHMDESSPHIHILTVPLTKDGRLCAKEMTAKREMQRRQSSYAVAMAEFGLERGVPAEETKREHIPLKGKPGSGGKAAAQAKEQAALLAQTQAELVTVQGELVQVNEKFDKLTKKSAHQLATNVQFMNELNKLDAEKKALLKTSQGYKAAALEIEKIASERDRELVKVQGELVKVNGALATATAQATAEAKAKAQAQSELVNEITELRKENADALAMIEDLKAQAEALSDQEQEERPDASVMPEKSLVERLAASYAAFMAWIKGEGGQHCEAKGGCAGRVMEVDEFHFVQKVGRNDYSIHRIEDLDLPRAPAKGDMLEISIDSKGKSKTKITGQSLGR
jgi:hypothetical protein